MMFCERTAMSPFDQYLRLECLVTKVQQHIFRAAKVRHVAARAAKNTTEQLSIAAEDGTMNSLPQLSLSNKGEQP